MVTVVVVIDGLQAEGREITLPTFQPSGVLTWREQAAWSDDVGVWGELFALPPGKEPAVAYLTALGLGLQPDPDHTWCCLGFTHLHQRQEKLLFVSHRRTGLAPEEQGELATALMAELAPEGWTLHEHPTHPLLSRAEPVAATMPALSDLEGRSLLDVLPQGPGAAPFRSLLTTGQMALARHPVNQARARVGRLPLNTPWFWGVGAGRAVTPPAPRGRCWTPLPAVAGLAGQRGFAATVVTEEEPLGAIRDAVLAMTTGAALIHLASPLILARHGQWRGWQERLLNIEQELLAPIAASRRWVVTGGMAVDAAGSPCWRPAPLGGEPPRRASSWLTSWRRPNGELPATSCLESWLS